MDIKSMTVEQLKALAYDQAKIFEKTRQNLQLLNARINELEVEKEKIAEKVDG